MANEKRNASIDITKFILALIVVMLHSATECLGTEHMAVRVIEYSGRFVRADDEDLSALVSRLHFS